jgi:hypothetical protein
MRGFASINEPPFAYFQFVPKLQNKSKINKPMKMNANTVAIALILASAGAVSAITHTDNADNYGTVWNSGSNGGTGFGAWTLSSSGGTGGFAGAFLGNPSDAGISGMPTNSNSRSFALYANPLDSGSFVNAERGFSKPLGVGDSFSFVWGINWDSGSRVKQEVPEVTIYGNKGFSIYSGGTSGTQLINVNNAGSSVITINGTNVGFGYGTTAMTWTITRTSTTSLQVEATNRDVSLTAAPNYSGTFTISGAPDSFKFYASGMQAGDQVGDKAQPYFNNFQLNLVDGFGNWASANAPGQTASQDHDGDGVPNGVEYFMGESGSSFTTNPQPVDGTITWPRNPNATGLTFKVLSSTDLVTWNDVTLSANTTDPASVSYTLPNNGAKRFARLEVTIP